MTVKQCKEKKLCIIGLGYVGLPLAVNFSVHLECIGYDQDIERVNELNLGIDRTNEVDLQKVNKKNITFTSSKDMLKDCNVFVVTVPTPVDKNKNPDLSHLISASKLIAKNLKKMDLVIFESTVYPGATEEVCLPILEESSGFKLNDDFYLGYSPERVNPGDKIHSLSKITKVISASNDKALSIMRGLYSLITNNNLHEAPSIIVAEAAKVIENTQRDLNIALINELAILFNSMNINVSEVLEVASTKWNFLNFEPGLVGGHCIGVDPYYLTYKAKKVGYEAKLILAGRKINDGMTDFIIQRINFELKERKKTIDKSKILLMGITFKENCPDIRNSKSIELYEKLTKLGASLKVYDPWISDLPKERIKDFNVLKTLGKDKFDVIILTVKHNEFLKINQDTFHNSLLKNSFIYDIKSCLSIKDNVVTL